MKKYLAYLCCFSVCLLFSFCASKKKKAEPIRKYYVSYQNDEIDTSNQVIVLKSDIRLQIKYQFLLDNKGHVVRVYDNYNTAAVDGAYYCYQLDTLGVIFSCSDTWNSFYKMRTNNDSLNRIIDFAIDFVNTQQVQDWQSEYERTHYEPKEVLIGD